MGAAIVGSALALSELMLMFNDLGDATSGFLTVESLLESKEGISGELELLGRLGKGFGDGLDD